MNRGGTVLQPGVTRLREAEDFPKNGPVLIVTDAACDRVRVRRDHGFLIPAVAVLPFRPRGPVFRFSWERRVTRRLLPARPV